MCLWEENPAGPTAAKRATGGEEGAETTYPGESSSLFGWRSTMESVAHVREPGRRQELVTSSGRASPMVILWGAEKRGSSWLNALSLVQTLTGGKVRGLLS